MAKQETYLATLTDGSTYVLRNKTFTKGKPKVVTAKEKAHLEVHAVDRLNADQGPNKPGKLILQQKFTFEKVTASTVLPSEKDDEDKPKFDLDDDDDLGDEGETGADDADDADDDEPDAATEEDEQAVKATPAKKPAAKKSTGTARRRNPARAAS